MKKLLLLFTAALFINNTQAQYEDMPIDCLVEAIIQVESRGDSTAKGDRGWAVGVLQIWPIMVREVNRIQEKNGSNVRYGYNDRYSVKKSIEMFHIWREYYHSDSDWETIARCWNGGPSGSSHHRTKCYWNKVRRELDLLAYYH